MVLKEILALVGLPIIRSAAGWAENALRDNKITNFEWKQLGETVLRVGFIGVATYFGLNELGFDVSALGASASAIILDFVLSAIRKSKK